MTAAAEKHKSTIEESITRLIARAADARGLQADDVRPRVERALAKYLFRDNENAAPSEINAFIDGLRADDLCLVLACEKGDEEAWNYLVKTQDATVKAAAWKVSTKAEDAEDLAGLIWAELYGLKHDRDGKLKSKLSYYSGRGSLGGWLRAVVSQFAVDEYRLKARLVNVEESRDFENLANESSEKAENLTVITHHENAADIFDEQQLLGEVSKALNQSIAELGADDRLLLKLYYFDELKLKDIGKMFGYHEATASRKIVRIQTEIRNSVENRLKNGHNWSDEEVKRYLAETASKLGFSFENLAAILIIFAFVQEILR